MHRNPSSKQCDKPTSTSTSTVLLRLGPTVRRDLKVTPKGKTNLSVWAGVSAHRIHVWNVTCEFGLWTTASSQGKAEAVGVWSHVGDDNQFKHNQKVKRD